MSTTIVIDTREQRPYTFDGLSTVRRALPSGDYSLDGLEHSIAIERKSLDDWVHTILRARRRFRAELKRLQRMDFAAIVIEGSVADILAGRYKSDAHPRSILGMTASIMQHYRPVQVVFAGDRPHAAHVVRVLLEQAERNDEAWQ